MAENPLLPHDTLRELHGLMLRYRGLERKQKPLSAAREAFYAGTSIHLDAGDLLSATPEDRVAAQLAPESTKKSAKGILLPDAKLADRLPLCAAAARGMQAAETDRLVLVFAHAGSSERGWQASLEWEQRARLPLILACSDATGGTRFNRGRPSEQVLDFETISTFARRTKLPVFTVDGEDAVAVYRVMQECVLRARFGGGPAVLWAVLTPIRAGGQKPKRADAPLARMESYMAARNVLLE